MTAGQPDRDAALGLAAATAEQLRSIFAATPGVEGVWVYGSHARGEQGAGSDLDLAVDAPRLGKSGFSELWSRVQALESVQDIELVWLQDNLPKTFRDNIERDRRLFWAPRRQHAELDSLGGIALKQFQSETLTRFGDYLDILDRKRRDSERVIGAIREQDIDVPEELHDFPRKAWDELRDLGKLPAAHAQRPHSSRFDGAGNAIPNVCLKIPTGGGKTLLAAACVARTLSAYLNRHTGLVLWIVPNEAIYQQTKQALTNRDHPYRQMLNVAGAGRVKILEKTSPLSAMDADNNLCVMLLMMASAARKSKETLRFFRDRGNVRGFVPDESDLEAHWQLLQKVPNLDAYAPWGTSAEAAAAQRGSIVKASLGNVMRIRRPVIVMDEGHHAYTDNALKTLDGFNPSLLLELSATPRVANDGRGGSNILVDVRGTDLDAAEMIKLPIHVDVRRWGDWQSCLQSAVDKLAALQRDADTLRGDTARYIRPILLVQVERTGQDLEESGYIHAEHARAHLLQLGFSDDEIAVKTSEKNELNQPENLDLTAPTCRVRAIITKQALQEGWDCPFAYVLCALAAGRSTGAMTQLLGRILRQPHVHKTGVAALDACYAYCNDARTADVVRGIKRGLEADGMGDLALSVTSDAPDAETTQTIRATRRKAPQGVRLFLPRVTWINDDETRRELDYASDVLARLDWGAIAPETLCTQWRPNPGDRQSHTVQIGLDVLEGRHASAAAGTDLDATLPAMRVVRALLDLIPNAWHAASVVEWVLERLNQQFAPDAVAASGSSLIETLRAEIETRRDALAQQVFDALVAEGRVEFRLRADATDYELPRELDVPVDGKPTPMIDPDTLEPMQRSLLKPVLQAMFDNEFERDIACYLDKRETLVWWHRNVAKAQYGLQGWKRHKVYPDFVFARLTDGDRQRVVLLETKGAHLKNEDTDYKQALLDRLTKLHAPPAGPRVGELALDYAGQELHCDLLFDNAWEGQMNARFDR